MNVHSMIIDGYILYFLDGVEAKNGNEFYYIDFKICQPHEQFTRLLSHMRHKRWWTDGLEQQLIDEVHRITGVWP